MRNFFLITMSILGMGVILACNLGTIATQNPTAPSVSNTAVSTPVAPPAETTAPTQNAPQSTKVSFENVSLVIPTDLGVGANTTKTDDVEMPPFVNPSNGPMPQHIVITLNGYPIGREARIAVFKASEYASYTGATENTISELQSLNFQAGGNIPPDLGGTLETQASPVAIQNGHGLRYVTEIMGAYIPISNDQIYYYYQGMTNDGVYFVLAVLPINMSFLAPTYDPDAVIPSGGIQFPPYSNPNATTDDIKAYYDAIKQKMNAAAPNDFTPSLATLDTLIQSITVTP